MPSNTRSFRFYPHQMPVTLAQSILREAKQLGHDTIAGSTSGGYIYTCRNEEARSPSGGYWDADDYAPLTAQNALRFARASLGRGFGFVGGTISEFKKEYSA